MDSHLIQFFLKGRKKEKWGDGGVDLRLQTLLVIH